MNEKEFAIETDPRYIRATWMLDNQITGPEDLKRFWDFFGFK